MQNAMPMLMTGGNKKGAQAKKLKLVDMTCDANQVVYFSHPSNHHTPTPNPGV